MRVLVVGTGEMSSRIALRIVEAGHQLGGQIPMLQPAQMDAWDFEALIVVGPESPQTPSATLEEAVTRGKHVLVIGHEADPLASWSRSARLPVLAYPLTQADLRALVEELARREQGRVDTQEEYARARLGGELAARVQATMAVRRVAITSPKGGTGKTTVAVNLAVLLALCGVKTYLVDADANAVGVVPLHLRLDRVKETLIRLMRTYAPQGTGGVMSGVAVGGKFLSAFTPVPDLPGLHVLPGFTTLQDLSDPVLAQEDLVRAFFRDLYEVAATSSGVMIMDVGINPAHVVHRAVLAAAETVVMVVQPEIPDLYQVRQWLLQIMRALVDREGLTRDEALSFLRSRIRLVYNRTVGRVHVDVTKVLEQALTQAQIPLSLAPHGVLPLVPPDISLYAVNANSRDALFVLRYLKKKEPELRPYVEALVGFAANFVPTVPEAAARIGLLPPSTDRKRFRLPWRR